MKKLVLMTVSGLLASAAGAQDVKTSGAFIDGIVAIVNDGVVLQSELDAEREMIVRRFDGMPDAPVLPPRDVFNDQILERLILIRLQLQRAERMGILVSDEIVNRAMSRIAAEGGITINELPQVLAQQGIDYAAYREELRQQITLDQLRQIDVLGRIAVSEREIEQCLSAQIGRVNVNAEYNLSHILISVPEGATEAQYNEAESRAREVLDKLASGTSFAELAVAYSGATETALEGGALGWRRGNLIPTLFADVVADMNPGDASEPIRSASGLHIVRLNDMRGAVQKSQVNQSLIRHILVQTNEIIDDRTAEQRLRDAKKRIEAGETFGELARLISDDPGSSRENGEMGWTDPGTFVPEFEQVADSLEIGTISEPFKSRFGWHILEVMDRRVYDNTAEMRERNCVANIRNSRVEEETELWLRRLRDDAFVDKRI